MVRRLLVATLIVASMPLAAAFAQSADSPPPVEVVDVSGPMDRLLVDFVTDVIEKSDAQLVILSIDSPGAVDRDVEELIELVADPPVPVVVWVGPAPAVARGGAAQLLLSAPIRAAAPDVSIGDLVPTVAGSGPDLEAVLDRFPDVPVSILDSELEIAGPVEGVVDIVSPSVGQLVVGLHGTEVEVRGRTAVLDTAELVVEDGVEVTKPSAEVVFEKPGVFTRTLRVALRAEAAFFFLLVGLALVAFEFYAAGPGVAAAVGVLCLLLSGYGMAVLPVNWWAVLASVAGLALYTVDFQRNDLGWKSILGTGLLVVGGMWFIDGSGQVAPVWWGVLLAIASAAFFFGIALTTVVRARFSTSTIGRETLIGRGGVAISAFSPEGVVDVDGARWRARSFRAARIEVGDDVRVVAVDGIVLDVEPAEEE